MGSFNGKMSIDAKLNKVFDSYKDKYEDSMLEDGIEKLCKDLHVAPDDFRVLVLAWKLSAQMMCRFTRTEFVCGLQLLQVDSVKALQARLPELVAEVGANLEEFKQLYRFTFKFGLDAACGERILPTQMAVELWQLVFTVHEPRILKRWLNFLSRQDEYRGISKDTWEMFLTFSDAVDRDLNSYDSTEAWPTIFDDFVEYEISLANNNIGRCHNRTM